MSLNSIISFLAKRCFKSQIEFYLCDAFEIYHYLPIYNELLSRGVKALMIAEPCRTNTTKIWFDYDTAIHILKELKIDYRTKADPNCPLAITTQASETLGKYNNIKINITYGVPLLKNNFSISKDSCIGFSARLVHGEYQKQLVAKFMREEDIYVVGYPKHDKFFMNPKNSVEIAKSFGITTRKPILLYAPSWHDDSSIMMFADEVGKLRDRFFVVTKPHHCTFRLTHKKDDLKRLYKISDIVVDGNTSLEPLAVLADIAVADAKSGAATELRFLNQKLPLIMLTPQQDIDAYLPEIHKIGIVINSIKNFEEIMRRKIEPRQFDMEDFYGKTDGGNASRAADVLIHMMERFV